MADITLPELAEGVEKAVVTTWHSAVGDKINEGDDLVEMATDKATFNVPSTVSGTIKKLCFEEGDDVKVGQVLAVIE